jgi:hypothetical protein
MDKSSVIFYSDKQEEYFDILNYEGWLFDSQHSNGVIIMVKLGENDEGICVDADCYIQKDGSVTYNDFDF